jgi:hypothetical protein
MAIRSNISPAPIALAAVSTDTTLLAAVTGSRFGITGMSIFNTTASTDLTVDIYDSSNTTSASGTKIASYIVGGNSSIDVVELIGQGVAATRNIIGRQTTSGATSGQLNCKISYTQYSGADATV